MPIAPAAKGIIIVGGAVIAASVALYQNEQVQEWIQRTGEKVSRFWEDVVGAERQAAMGHSAGTASDGRHGAGNRERGGLRRVQSGLERAAGNDGRRSEVQQERRRTRRTLWEDAMPDVVAANSQQESVDASGVRRRKARDVAGSSQDVLLDSISGIAAADAAEEEESKKEILFDHDIQATSLLYQADSVLDLVPAGNEGTGVWKLGEQSDGAMVEGPTIGDTAGNSTILQTTFEVTRTAMELSLLDQNTETSVFVPHSEPLVDITESSGSSESETQAQTQLPFRQPSPSNILASSHLTLSVPSAPTNPFEDSSYHTPATLSIPGSPSFISTPDTSSSADIHTPPLDNDDGFGTWSEAGTETAGYLSLDSVDERLRQGQRAWEEERDDEVSSMASSGWSDVGRES